MGSFSGIVPAVVPGRHDRIARACGYLASSFSWSQGFASWTSPFKDFSRRVRSPVEYFTSAVIGQALTDAGIEYYRFVS